MWPGQKKQTETMVSVEPGGNPAKGGVVDEEVQTQQCSGRQSLRDLIFALLKAAGSSLTLTDLDSTDKGKTEPTWMEHRRTHQQQQSQAALHLALPLLPLLSSH